MVSEVFPDVLFVRSAQLEIMFPLDLDPWHPAGMVKLLVPSDTEDIRRFPRPSTAVRCKRLPDAVEGIVNVQVGLQLMPVDDAVMFDGAVALLTIVIGTCTV